MIIDKVLHPRDDVDILYVSRKEMGREIASIQDSVDVSIQNLEDNIKNAQEDWSQPPETTQPTQVSIYQKSPPKKKWEEKLLYGHFNRQTS